MIPPELPFSHNANGTILDRLGNQVAYFKDPQHAEYVCGLSKTIDSLEDDVDRLEHKIDTMQSENEDLRSGLDNLRK